MARHLQHLVSEPIYAKCTTLYIRKCDKLGQPGYDQISNELLYRLFILKRGAVI